MSGDDDDERLRLSDVGRELALEIIFGAILLFVSILLLPVFAVAAVGAVVFTAFAWLYFRIKNEPSKGRHAR